MFRDDIEGGIGGGKETQEAEHGYIYIYIYMIHIFCTAETKIIF